MERRRNLLLWAGFLTILLAIVINVPAVFVAIPGQHAAVWLTIVIPIVALLLVILGLARSFRRPAIYRGKVIGSILTVVAVLILAGSVFGLVFSRRIPAANQAPQIGQKAPDFTLSDSHGQQVSLAELLKPANAPQPKAVLLIFYRGYW